MLRLVVLIFSALILKSADGFEIPPDDLELDPTALFELAQQDQAGIVSMLREKYGVTVLELPIEDSPADRTYSTEAWAYYHSPGMEELEGAFLHAFAPTLVMEGTEEVVVQGGRPYFDKDLIFFRTGLPRLVVLHEAAHYLIGSQRRRRSGLDAQGWAEYLISGEKTFSELFARKESVTALEWEKALSTVVEQRVRWYLEEYYINAFFLRHGDVLKLTVSDLQTVSYSMKCDLKAFFERAFEIIEAAKRSSDENGLPHLRLGAARAEKHLARARRQATRELKDFFEVFPSFELLSRFAERMVLIDEPDFHSASSNRILGLDPYRQFDHTTVRKIYGFWKRQLEGDRDPGKIKSIKAATALLLSRGVSMECAAALHKAYLEKGQKLSDPEAPRHQ